MTRLQPWWRVVDEFPYTALKRDAVGVNRHAPADRSPVQVAREGKARQRFCSGQKILVSCARSEARGTVHKPAQEENNFWPHLASPQG